MMRAAAPFLLWSTLAASLATLHAAQAPAALRLTPNLVGQIGQPLRYRPEGGDFVIENGPEFFNRPLYGGNTAFRVDAGDKPEFTLYLPGRGGNLRFGLRSGTDAKWLSDAAKIVTRYRPGEMLYEIRDPLLGAEGVLRLTVLAYEGTEGLIVRAGLARREASESSSRREEAGPTATTNASGFVTPAATPIELVWAYGGVNGQRGSRDGDIGTERMPIGEYFQLQPEFCRDNAIELRPPGGFTLRAKAATIVGVTPPAAQLALADATHWRDLPALLGSVEAVGPASGASTARTQGPALQVIVGRVPLVAQQLLFFSLQRVAVDGAVAEELDTYKEVTADRKGVDRRAKKFQLSPAYTAAELPRRFADTEQYFTALRQRVSIETPDAFINVAAGALNVATDAVWDEPENAIMHGAIAWRTKLLGWRGPYLLDALGWHDRARSNISYWVTRQNTDPIPAKLPPPDENSNLARSETALHSNGDMSNSHYDMNLVFIDGLFRHLLWTGDLNFARQVWPVIERHLAWERRLFRREFGPDKLPLYEAYAVIWASDDLQYGGGGVAHASAYNYYHNKMAARLAKLLGHDPKPYEREADLIAQAMRKYLWLPEQGMFAESKDLLGLQLVHPSAGLWTFYHTVDSEVPTPSEAWQMTRYVDTQIPHLPVVGPGVPADQPYAVLSETNWMPYSWSINNVVMGEIVHTALGYWQAGRPDEAFRLTKSALLASMFMGICPGNVGSMNYLDVYRREAQRDFADGGGVTSRALIEGLFGVKPDALAGELLIRPGFPAAWDHASLRHPDINFSFRREGDTDLFTIEPKMAKPLALRFELPARREHLASAMVNGQPVTWQQREDVGGHPVIELTHAVAAKYEVKLQWSGAALLPSATDDAGRGRSDRRSPGEGGGTPPSGEAGFGGPALQTNPARCEPVDLARFFNDRVTEIFRKGKYRSPRSPFVSLAIPAQGIGAWAGHVDEMAQIDDSGLRAAAGANGGRLVLPNGVPFVTPGPGDAKNILFTSQWDNYPHEATVSLSGRAVHAYLLMAGSTNHMQSRFDNGEVIVTYRDGTTARLALHNPTNWWPIDQDYFIDDYQFRRPEPIPPRVDLMTGTVRLLDVATFKGKGRAVRGGAATVLDLPLDPAKELQSLTVRTLANEVVIGLMGLTLAR
jgi:hypothetical protein